MTGEKCNKDAENKKLGTLRQVTKERVIQNVGVTRNKGVRIKMIANTRRVNEMRLISGIRTCMCDGFCQTVDNIIGITNCKKFE